MIGLDVAVFIVFLVLKLVGTIDWSWWWVTCPLWALPAIWIFGHTAGAAGSWWNRFSYDSAVMKWRREEQKAWEEDQ